MSASSQIVDNTGGVDDDGNLTPDYPTQAQLDSLTQQAPAGANPRYTDKVNQLVSAIQDGIPGIGDPITFNYRRQTQQKVRDKGGAFGRLAVSSTAMRR